MGLMAEPCFQCDVAHWAVPLQEELSCQLNAAFHDIAVYGEPHGVPEQRFEVGHTETCNVGQLLERKVAIEVRFDVVAYSAKAPFRELTSRDVRDACWVVAGSL